MKHKGRMTVSRCYSMNSHDDGFIRIQLQELYSRIHFLNVEIPMAKFAALIFGTHTKSVEFDVHGALNLGKKYVQENVTLEIPESAKVKNDKASLKKWIKDTQQRPGWIISAELGSQGDVTTGGLPEGIATKVKFSYYTYVDMTYEERQVIDNKEKELYD